MLGSVCGGTGHCEESTVSGVSFRHHSLPKLEFMVFFMPRVFNHYNRVHANLQFQSDLKYTEWADQDERMYVVDTSPSRLSVSRQKRTRR
jgi:hypothetical protein